MEKYDDEYREDLIQNAVSLFDNLMDFCRVTFPDHVLEMRDPYLVFERQLLTAWYYRTISYSSKTKIFQHNAFFTCITNSEMVYNLVK